MEKFWYKSGNLRYRIGIITWYFNLGYVELKDLETSEYVIKHITDIEKIN